MNFDSLAQNMTPDIYSRLREAVELGRWPNQVPLSKEQRSLCLEAVLKYEINQQIPEQRRTGFIEQGCRSKSETIPTVTLPDASEL
ncbi:MAG: YeaC family protein [Reinekea forsetii]|nr:YeaC family protein [Reinekea forsetii]MDO7644359.1 YeaC family protein [Reinekea forsetii]MDO7674930.1 YeaC family protein [Reinekea forsetii]